MIKLLPILEMPQLTLKGKTAYTPDNIALKKAPASTAFDNIVFYINEKANFMHAEGYFMMWYIDSNSTDFVKSLNAGESDILYFPIKVQMFSGSPITDIWKKKKGLKNTDKIVAATQGWISKDDKTIYVNMISVRSKWRNNNIATIMMNYLKSEYSGYKITISKTTPNGTAFFKKYDTDSSLKYDTVDHYPI